MKHCLVMIAVLILALAPPVRAKTSTNTQATRSPIRHLIVVSGENRSFDNVFATYLPPDKTQTVWNLLSRGIVQSNGQPGPNFHLAQQRQATSTERYELSPTQTGPLHVLPQPSTTLDALPFSLCTMGKLEATVGISLDPLRWNWSNRNYFCSSNGLRPKDYVWLKQGGSGQPFYRPSLGLSPVPDCRYPSALPNGPYPVVGASVVNKACFGDWTDNLPDIVFRWVDRTIAIKPVTYASHTGDPVHRFFQMWQQADCSPAHATTDNPSGCLGDLYTWVATTVGWDIAEPANDQDTYQGGVAMGYYNMAQGDWPFLRGLAETYAISDNYHQPVMGGTGVNSQFMVTGDVYFFTDAQGKPGEPPSNLVENPNPKSGSNNFYLQDQLGDADLGSTGVSFTKCSDRSQPGVAAILDYLQALPYPPFNGGNCSPSVWYQVNNNYPYYNRAGMPIGAADKNAFPAGSGYSIGPQTIPTIGEALASKKVSWKYYGEGMAVANKRPPRNQIYCAICNGFQYSRSIMSNPSLRNNLVDLTQFYRDLRSNSLPAVSFVKPGFLTDGHPGTSTPPLFEAFLKKLVSAVRANPNLWAETAILVTFDEGGGLYDSGYIQPIDFFGDGPRTVMIAVSPFAKRGKVDHTYADHASILKFIEWNWSLPPLSSRSRDNLPNPLANPGAPYFPTNAPAVGDLTTLFDFNPK